MAQPQPSLLRLDRLFADAANAENFAEGETVFAEGDTGNFMFVVIAGTIDIYMGDRLIDIAGPGDLLGELALIDAAPRSASAVARTAASLVKVGEKEFLHMVADTPFFALHVMRLLVRRMRRKEARA